MGSNNRYIHNLGLLFYAIAKKNASKAALRYEKMEVAYEQLNNISNQIARFLLAQKVQTGDVVCIFNDKSVNAYASMLACLKIGAIYSNLDITNPLNRINKIINTCRPKLILNDFEDNVVLSDISKQGQNVIDINQDPFISNLETYDQDNLDISSKINGSNPAYIMFTSGSTGFPKGAIISHDNIMNFINWCIETYDVNAQDIFTNVNPIYFDNSVFDFYTSIFSGASMVPVQPEKVSNPKELVRYVNQMKCTIWFSVPSLLVYLLTTKTINEKDFSSIKRFIFGGEGFPKSKLKLLYDMFGKRSQLINVYGPTECTCICSSHIIAESDFENMIDLATLGNISANFGYEILPSDREEISFGELCLTGPQVGLGYYNDIDRTKESFVNNDFNNMFKVRMYRTGDLVKVDSKGYLHFKGRTDKQIKHMGYRIELEEIEAALSSLPYVNEAAVVYDKFENGLGQIIAFVNVSAVISEKEIIIDIKEIVPSYMAPKFVKFLDILPKNKNGKIDQIQLKQFIESD